MVNKLTYKRDPFVPRLDKSALSNADAEILASVWVAMSHEKHNGEVIDVPLRSLKLDASDP